MFSVKSVWNPTTGEELNCVRERMYETVALQQISGYGYVNDGVHWQRKSAQGLAQQHQRCAQNGQDSQEQVKTRSPVMTNSRGKRRHQVGHCVRAVAERKSFPQGRLTDDCSAPQREAPGLALGINDRERAQAEPHSRLQPDARPCLAIVTSCAGAGLGAGQQARTDLRADPELCHFSIVR